MRLVYLASPYSHPDPAVREQRYEAACAVAAAIIRAEPTVNVFAPIVHSHPLTRYGLDGDWETWRSIDEDWIRRCDEVWALRLDGWYKSRGMREELDLAFRLRKTVRSVMPGDYLESSVHEVKP